MRPLRPPVVIRSRPSSSTEQLPISLIFVMETVNNIVQSAAEAVQKALPGESHTSQEPLSGAGNTAASRSTGATGTTGTTENGGASGNAGVRAGSGSGSALAGPAGAHVGTIPGSYVETDHLNSPESHYTTSQGGPSEPEHPVKAAVLEHHEYHSSGFKADGGNFDAAHAGAGEEAIRLMASKGMHFNG